MIKFHDDMVRLSKNQQDEMRDRRDNGRTRLENGLSTNGHPQPKEIHSQGSYSMRTMVQDDQDDYDIDDGVYFSSEDLKDASGLDLTPLAARERVCNALKWDDRLKYDAEVKRNCVRQKYPAGYHIDLPVYRIVTNEGEDGKPEEHYELAAGDKWEESDAREVTRWFNNRVGELNTGEEDGSQMRRVVKLTKKFSRRLEWKEQTTSGIIITKLVMDHFVSAVDREDQSLRDTWKAILGQLEKTTEVKHPILDTNLASDGDNEVVYFRDCLCDALKTLEVLDGDNCTKEQARDAWDNVFDATFFSTQPSNEKRKYSTEAAMAATSNDVARRDDGGGRFG
jgi:hypothetical protein